MAFATKSVEFTTQESVRLQAGSQFSLRNSSPMSLQGLPVKYAVAQYTHSAGADTGSIDLLRLPSGAVRMWTGLSKLITSQFAANPDLHVGLRAYKGVDGSLVVEDNNLFADNLDAGGAALDQSLPLPAVGYYDIDSAGIGPVVFATVDTGNLEDDDTVILLIAYSIMQ